MQYIIGVVCGFILCLCVMPTAESLFPAAFLARPSQTEWKPVANATDGDDLDSYKNAAAKLGVEIKIGYPVPCMAGADYVARHGGKGIYIRRDQADKIDALTEGMFDARRNLEE